MRKWLGFSLAFLLSLAGVAQAASPAAPLDLLKRSEAGAALTQTQFDANYTAIENWANTAMLLAIEGLTPATDNIIYFTSGTAAALTPLTAAARTVLDDTTTGAMLTTLGGQPSNSNLTGYAGLTSAANVVPYFTGTGGAQATTAFTAAGRSMVGAADAAAQLALVGGQASNVNLTGLSGLTSAADKVFYFTGPSGASALADLTSLARTLLAGTTASGMRNTLAVGPLASGGYNVTPLKSTAYTAGAGDVVLTDTSGGAFTVTLPASPNHGDTVMVVDATSSWGTANLTIGRNSQNIDGAASNQTLTNGRSRIYIYSSTGGTWRTATPIIGTDVQAASAQLTSAAAVGDGLIAHTAANTFTPRTLAADGTVITSWTNPGGVAGNPTPVFDGDVTAIAGATDGIQVHTAANTFMPRSIAGDGTVVPSVTNANGVSGNPTLTFDGDITALAGQTGTGLVSRTGSNAYAERTLTAGGSNSLVVTNGDGSAGNPTVEMANPVYVAGIVGDASTTTSSTPSDVSGIGVALPSGFTFNIDCNLPYRSSVGTGGLIVALTYNGTFSAFEVRIPSGADGLGREWEGKITGTGGSVTAPNTPTANVTYIATVNGILKTGGATTFQVQMGSEDGSSTITPKAGGNCVATKIG